MQLSSNSPETSPRQQWWSTCSSWFPLVGQSLYERSNLSASLDNWFSSPQRGQERQWTGGKVHRAQRGQVGVCSLLKRVLCLLLRNLPSSIASIENTAEEAIWLPLIIPIMGLMEAPDTLTSSWYWNVCAKYCVCGYKLLKSHAMQYTFIHFLSNLDHESPSSSHHCTPFS